MDIDMMTVLKELCLAVKEHEDVLFEQASKV